MSSPLAPVVITMGEPAGIGAEITLRAWQALRDTDGVFFLLHDPNLVSEAARALSLDVPVRTISSPSEALAEFGDALPVMPVRLEGPVEMGRPGSRNAAAVVNSIRLAVDLALSGKASGLVTNPIQKSVLYESGFRFPGHTEYLENLAGAGYRATMMLASEELKVVPVSIHESLAAAVRGISAERIVEVARAAEAGLRRDFGLKRPRLAVAGLNPHAGEGGSMGREEIEVIGPAVEALRQGGMEAQGPYPPTRVSPRGRAAPTMRRSACITTRRSSPEDPGCRRRRQRDHGASLRAHVA